MSFIAGVYCMYLTAMCERTELGFHGVYFKFHISKVICQMLKCFLLLILKYFQVIVYDSILYHL
jgi:hypothetical protein